MKKGVKVAETLASMKQDDIYSLMLFTMYKLKDDPNYLTLIELSYLLDRNSLSKFLRYYGGMTIKVPDSRDLRLVLEALKLYEYVNLEGGNFKEGLGSLCKNEFSNDEIKEVYAKLCEVTQDYDFNRE